MGAHGDIQCSDMLRQVHRDGRRPLALIAAPFQREADGVGVRDAAAERLGDGGLQFGGAIAVQKPDQGGRDGGDGVAALGGLLEQALAGWRRLEEPVIRPMMAGGALVFDQRFDVGGRLDLRPLVIAARVAGDDLAAVGDANLIAIGQHGQLPTDMGVGDRVVIEIEADIGCLADRDLLAFGHGIGVVRQLQQPGGFPGKDLPNTEARLLGAAPIGGRAATPSVGLDVEVVHAGDLAAGKEIVADIADGALDAALLVAAGDGDRSRIEPVVAGEGEQRGVEADGVGVALQDGAFQIVVEQNPGHPIPCLEGRDVAGEEALHARVQEEAQEDAPGVAEHHDEGHQRPAGLTNGQVAEVPPIDLGLFAGQGSQAQIGLGLSRPHRTMTGDQVAEVIGRAVVAALTDHAEQSAGGERGEFLQSFADEGQERIDPRRPLRRAEPWQSRLGENPAHGVGVEPKLAGDGADPPLLDMVIAQYLGLKVGVDGHGGQVLFGHAGIGDEGRDDGDARPPGERTPSRDARTSGSGMPPQRTSGGVAHLRQPFGPAPPNHPMLEVVNPDASRSSAALDTAGSVRRARSDHRGSADSVAQPRAGRHAGRSGRSRQHSMFAHGHSGRR